MIEWPASLPGPRNNELSIKPGDTRKRRKTASGRMVIRRFGDGPPDQISVVFRMDGDERLEFQRWYERDLNLGTNWFIADWLLESGYGYHTARFLGYPRVIRKGFYRHDLSATLLVYRYTGLLATEASDLLVTEDGDFMWTFNRI